MNDRKTVTFIDVGNIPPNEVVDYMEEMLCKYKNIPYIKPNKMGRVKKFIRDLFSTLGIAGIGW